MKMTRRNFARLAAAVPLASAAGAATVSNPDVVIVGAGAAGIGAAQTLINGGRSVQIVEASARIGGRCFTDTASFGVPFERGAAWLKGGKQNPLAGFAQLYRFEIGRRDARELVFPTGDHAPLPSNGPYQRAVFALSDAIANAAEQPGDVAAGDAVPLLLDDTTRAWAATAAAAVGSLDMGVDLASLSAKDWFQREEAETRRGLRQGMGTLIQRLAFGMPIAVNTVARRVSVARGGVAVETDRGTLRAKAAIVTASLGVLAAGAIRFDPAPDTAMLGAFAGLPMGLVTKVALFFAAGSRAVLFAEDSTLIPQASDARGHVFHVRPFGALLAVCHVGGSLAWELARQSEAAQIAFVREKLRDLLGSKGDAGLRKAVTTNWGSNPFMRGAFAAALPGQWKTRRALDQPIGECVFLAGEAQADKAIQTVHGAFQSGQRAGRRVQQLLNA
jgi:monoamine oxidase